MKLPHKTLERKLLAGGYHSVIGVDEVGMGCLAGPVVVCAVLFDRKFFLSQRLKIRRHPKLAWLRDSKLLIPRKREEFAAKLIAETGLKFQISQISPKIIDKINIYQASRLAMRRAILGLVKSKSKILNPKQIQNSKSLDSKHLKSSTSSLELAKTIVLVDGPHKIKGLDLKQIPIVKGDQKVFAIACASILAKVARDKIMAKLAKKYPNYSFEKHKGYGTKLHLAQLAALGPCKIHRKSFRPVAKLI